MNAIFRHKLLGQWPGWAAAHVLFLVVFAWNQFYIPLHLAGEHHADERAVLGEVFGAEEEHHDAAEHHDEPEHHDESGHAPHPESDHLSGYIGHGPAPLALEVQLVSVPLDANAPTIAWPVRPLLVPSERGPPLPSLSLPG